jgi:tetratricopeptide (TPR) repeat protein
LSTLGLSICQEVTSGATTVTERTLCPVLVGRQSELAIVEDALIDAARGDGRFVVIAGDAGMGKTRLTIETQALAAKLGFTSLRGGCAPTDVAIPYLPLLEAAGNQLARADLARVREWVGTAATDLVRLFPQMEGSGLPPATVDPGGDSSLRLFESVVLLLSALSDGGPLLLTIEDLQWSDPATRDLVDYLARRAPSLPLLVLATYRTDELHRRHPLRSTVHGWRRGGLAEFIELAPLTRADVRAMSQAIFADDVSDEFRDYIYDRTEGSPLALEEMLRDAIDRGDIFRSENGWDRKPLALLKIPREVAEVVLLRLDRLDAGPAAVLYAASVLGRSFSYSVLAAITDLSSTAVRAALDDLVKVQMLEPDTDARGRFRFRHALIQEAVYDQILSPHRDELHLRVAEVLRSTHASAVEVGNHLLRGGRVDDAVPVLLVAAQEAMTNFAALTAVEVYTRVLPHITDRALRAQVLCRLGESLWRSSQPSAAERCFREAITALAGGDDASLVARCRYLLGGALHDQGRAVEEEAEYEAALAMLAPLGPGEDLATVYLRLSRLRWSRSDSAGTIDMARAAIGAAESAGADAVRIWAGAYLGAAIADQGATEAGIAVLRQSCDEADMQQLHWITAAALRLEMDVLIRALRHAEVPALLGRLRRVPGMSPADEAVAECIEATVAFEQGDLARCVASLDGAQKLARRAGQETVAEGALLLRAAAHLAADEVVAARSLLPSVESATPALLELLLPLTVRLDSVDGDAEGAVRHARAGLAILSGTEVGAVVSEAVVRAYLAAGQVDEATLLLERVDHFTGPAREPYRQRAEGAIALQLGQATDAIRLLDHSSAAFARATSRWEELWTRILLARARATAGELDAAASELSTASAVAEHSGIALIVRIAGETHSALGLPGVRHTAPEPVRGVPVVRGGATRPGTTVAVVASAESARLNDIWRQWGEREAMRQHGASAVASDGLTVTFDAAGTNDTWTRALRFALGLRCKGVLLDVPVRAGIAAAVHDATRLAASADTDDILASKDLSSEAQAWLTARQLADHENAQMGAVRLRKRVGTLQARPVTAVRVSEPVPEETRNEFVVEGDYWSVLFAGHTSRLKDSKGLRDIARLMAAQGTEVAAIDLIAARTLSTGRVSGLPEEGFGIEGDAGDVLDADAREQYRLRLIELEAEVDDAAAANDPVRAERARDEREFLLAELRSAVGLHGHARRAIDPAERARKAVTWRIRDAITRAEAAHPAFGHHLRRSVRTGAFCVYAPEEVTQWTLFIGPRSLSREHPSP